MKTVGYSRISSTHNVKLMGDLPSTVEHRDPQHALTLEQDGGQVFAAPETLLEFAS